MYNIRFIRHTTISTAQSMRRYVPCPVARRRENLILSEGQSGSFLVVTAVAAASVSVAVEADIRSVDYHKWQWLS